MLILEGIPLVCLEMAVGQRLGRNSVVESWKDLSPSLRGIGVAAVLMSLVTLFYYNYIVAWCLYYFVHSMRSTLLWNTCPTINNIENETLIPECLKSSPAEYYWYRETLDVADDINNSTGEGWRYLIKLDPFVFWYTHLCFHGVMCPPRHAPTRLFLLFGRSVTIFACWSWRTRAI